MLTSGAIDIILNTARRLVPGLVASARQVDLVPPIIGTLRATGGFVGVVRGKPELALFIAMDGVGKWLLEFSRPGLPLSDQEWDVLNRLPDAIATTMSSPSKLRHRVAHQISSRLGLEYVLIAQVLRKTRAAGFWWPMIVLEALIDLTFKRYEGQQATTGIVFTSRDELYTKELGSEHPYVLERFSYPIPLSYDIFSAPTAFRYVDGRNSFYLLDRKFQLIGVLRARRPTDYSILDRCSLRHVEPLVTRMPGRVWLAYVGFNNDVHVLRSGGIHLHWHQNHWRVRDDGLLRTVLQEHGCDQATVERLLLLLNTLSELRLGSVMLIPADPERLPVRVGKIDTSAIASQLRENITASNIADLLHAHAAIGVLSSDGLTTITKSGEVISCGDIVDLGQESRLSIGGGGRSQAARAASAYGLALKISEDGPITPFIGGQPLLTL